ncbi:MAG: mechanosensitive ion channel family protein [Chloroflexi bacterium]|nr:mechanosensitive ion channel family protein [Chloroflexota bacterium]
MGQWIQWLIDNWLNVTIPVIAFLATYVVSLWMRRVAYRAFDRWTERLRWEGSKVVVAATRSPFLHSFLLLGAYIAIQVSSLSPEGKILGGRIVASLFILLLGWVAISVSEKLIKLYMSRIEAPQPPTTLAVNVVRITIIVLGVLILLDIWGAPTTPIILVLAAVVFIAGLALRDVIPNLLSGAQVALGEQIKVGDFIKLESGESGHVTAINWRNTQIKTLEGNLVLIPNIQLVRTTVTNFGHPVKKATYPFRFYTRLHLKELTGIKASNLRELVDILKGVPDSVVYYHTHHFLEEHHYLTPEPANDFALWVSDALGDEVLGERLASVDAFDFPTVGALKMWLVEVIEDYLAKNPDGKKAPEGQEFHFIRSRGVILSTPYTAHDLREFVEVLKKVTVDIIYFHMFESRLRLQKGTNDFSIWIKDCLGEDKLADKIARLDPYCYSLDSLRSTIIQLIEERM